MPDQCNPPATVLQHPSASAAFDVRSEAARLVAAYRAVQQAQFDRPTPEQFETLDVTDAIQLCIDKVGWPRFLQLVSVVGSARGELR